MSKWILENIGLILTAIGLSGGGGLIGVYFGRKKQAAETEQAEGNALKTMQEGYSQFTKDMNDRMGVMQKELDAVKLENIEQRKDIRSLTKDNRSLHNQVTALSNENASLRASIQELKNENERLKRKRNADKNK